jgi:hypothetical protein
LHHQRERSCSALLFCHLDFIGLATSLWFLLATQCNKAWAFAGAKQQTDVGKLMTDGVYKG